MWLFCSLVGLRSDINHTCVYHMNVTLYYMELEFCDGMEVKVRKYHPQESSGKDPLGKKKWNFYKKIELSLSLTSESHY